MRLFGMLSTAVGLLLASAEAGPARAVPVIPLQFSSSASVSIPGVETRHGESIDRCVQLIIVSCPETPLDVTLTIGQTSGHAFISGQGASSLSLSILGSTPSSMTVVTREKGEFLALTPFDAALRAFFPVITLFDGFSREQSLSYDIRILLETVGRSELWETRGTIVRDAAQLPFAFSGETIPVETSGGDPADFARIHVEDFLLEAAFGPVPANKLFSITVEKTILLRSRSGVAEGVFASIHDPFAVDGDGLIRGFGLDFVAGPLAVSAPSTVALLLLPLALLVPAWLTAPRARGGPPPRAPARAGSSAARCSS